MTPLRLLATLLWLGVAALQVVAAHAVRRQRATAVLFLLAAALIVVGAWSGSLLVLVPGCAAAVAAPVLVGLRRPDGPRPSHHAVRAALLAGLLILTAWA
jgi:hypothetical protein